MARQQRRKIITYIATSADGYIARPDGDVEWLNRRARTIDYGIGKFYPRIDTILWGRNTYDWLLDYYRKQGKKSGLFDTKLRQLRVHAQARNAGAAGRRIRLGTDQTVRPAAARDSGQDTSG